MPIEERWKPVSLTGYRGLYEVSDQGAVMSLRSCRILTPQLVKGYPIVYLRNHDNRDTAITVARLVLMTFCPIPHGVSWVALWKNGDRSDNRLINLKWRPRRTRAKLTEEAVRTIRSRWLQGVTGADLSREYGVSQCAISNIVNGRTWQLLDTQGV